MTRKVILEDNDGEELIPYTNLATSSEAGRIRPDNSTLTVNANGVISVNGVTGAEVGYLSGVTSAIQTQINNCVHKTGNETITGVKTFTGNNRITVLQNSTVTYNTAPSSDTFTDISFRDKNGYEMGVLEHVRYANNNTAIRMVAKGADGDWSTSLTVGRRADGTVYASAPTPTAGDNSNQIATTGWVNTVGNNVVHKTGDETISGTKTFEGTINSKGGVNFVNSTITKGTNPSSSQYWAFRFNDKTNSSTWSATRLGVIEGCLDTSGNTSLYFGTYKNEASSTASALLKVGYNLTSGAYATAPTPNVSSNGTNIATTAYINTKFRVVSTLPANPDSNVFYFIPES